jgi:hypothetical protein
MRSVTVNLEPGQFLAGRRNEGRALFLPVLSDARVGEEVAVRIGIFGQTIRATVVGKVAAVRRVGRPTLPPGVELHLDPGSMAAVAFLAMAARGEPVTFRQRSPRFAVERPMVVSSAGRQIETTTINVSEGGCAVRWQGPLPVVGDVVDLVLGGGLFKSRARTVVCWTQAAGDLAVGLEVVPKAGASLGLKLVTAGRAARAWRALVAEVARSGARAA